jgi:CHAD domain-containing protein
MTRELERVQKALHELSNSLDSLPADPAPENVHKLRTSSRRVEAVAAVLEPAVGRKSRHLMKTIKPLRKAAGEVRDMDVLVANARRLARYCAGPSLTHLLAHLETARKQNALELDHALDRRRKSAMDDLEEYSGIARSVLKRAKSASHSGTEANQNEENIHSVAMDLLRELGSWQTLDANNLHSFRLQVKSLRYTLQLDENADPGLVEALGEAQHRIGDWHDWHQLHEIAQQVLVLEQDRPLLDRIDATAKRRFNRALAAARALRGKYLSAPLAIGV